MGESESGCSGSAITTLDGQLVGTHIGGGEFREKQVGIATKAKYIRELVQKTIGILRSYNIKDCGENLLDMQAACGSY